MYLKADICQPKADNRKTDSIKGKRRYSNGRGREFNLVWNLCNSVGSYSISLKGCFWQWQHSKQMRNCSWQYWRHSNGNRKGSSFLEILLFRFELNPALIYVILAEESFSMAQEEILLEKELNPWNFTNLNLCKKYCCKRKNCYLLILLLFNRLSKTPVNYWKIIKKVLGDIIRKISNFVPDFRKTYFFETRAYYQFSIFLFTI